MKKILLLLALLVFSPSIIAQAAGIQVSPARLDFSTGAQTSTSLNLTVLNPTADVQVFEVYADDFTDVIKPLPASFSLESGGRKSVKITVSPAASKNQVSGSLATNLSVVAKPLADNKFSVGTGVKIPITINISAASQNPNQNQWIFFALGLLIILVLGYYFHKTKNSVN